MNGCEICARSIDAQLIEIRLARGSLTVCENCRTELTVWMVDNYWAMFKSEVNHCAFCRTTSAALARVGLRQICFACAARVVAIPDTAWEPSPPCSFCGDPDTRIPLPSWPTTNADIALCVPCYNELRRRTGEYAIKDNGDVR